MPRSYIVRLLFDRRHRSVALVRRGGSGVNGNGGGSGTGSGTTMLGGITYRVFPQQGVGEIAFCAVTASEQVKGFGTRLMNQAKAAARDRDGLTHFLTYAGALF